MTALAAADFYDRLRARGAAPSPFRRHPGLDQGPVRYRRRRDHGGLDRAADAAPATARRAGGGAAARCRLHSDRAHQHDRVRLLRARHQSALRHPVEPLRSQVRPHSRRLVLGRRRLGDRRHGVGGARHRHRRLVPHSGGAVRHRRVQADAHRVFRRRVRSRSRPRSIPSVRWRRRSNAAPCSIAVLAGEPAVVPAPFPLEGLRLAVPQTMVLDGMEPAVAQAFEGGLEPPAQRRARASSTFRCASLPSCARSTPKAALRAPNPMPSIAG